MSKGYGYAVWRTDQAFANPKQIVKGLSGCCGQMDIQAVGDDVFVAENSRHRIVRYNRDGEEVGKFGKTDREGLGEGFGGCCNPMNLCFTVDGGLLAAECGGAGQPQKHEQRRAQQRHHGHSTVTLFARLRGRSTSQPRSTAM